MNTEIMDTIMIECAQCCKKHLSAALAYYTEAMTSDSSDFGGITGLGAAVAMEYVARARINMIEAQEGYASHMDLARGFLVMAEESAWADQETQKLIRDYRLVGFERGDPPPIPSWEFMYIAHLREAERELPEIRRAVDSNDYTGGRSMQEQRQLEVDRIRAMIKWLDENIFLKEEGKGEEKMATKAKNACGKGGCAAKAKKAAAKGGCAAKGCKKGKK